MSTVRIRQSAGRVLLAFALLASIALVIAGAAAYLAKDKSPRLAIDGISLAAGNGRLQAFTDLNHELILSDEFAADPSVQPPILSRHQFSMPGFHFASILWGDNAVWEASVNSLVLLIVGIGLIGGLAYRSWRSRRREPALQL